jgi:glycosyltransferase involved in cell wall biosynthesis
MGISVIIPTLNEVGCLRKVIEEIPEIVTEIIVVDGGSTDGTIELAKSLGVKVVIQEKKGLGDALMLGIKSSHEDIVVLLDGDGSFNPYDIKGLVNLIQQGNEVVFGTRYHPDSGSQDDTPIRYLGNQFFTGLIRLIYKVNLSDSLFMYVAAKKIALETLNLKFPGFEFCIEFPIKVHLSGLSYTEMPSFERKRIAGKSKVNAFIHGLIILWTLIKLIPSLKDKTRMNTRDQVQEN